MNKTMLKLLSLLMALMMGCLTVPALADATVEVDGTVVNTAALPVLSAYSGTVEQLYVRDGSYVTKGSTIAVLSTTKVYATVDGTVRLFGDVGDSAAMISEHYGAVAYIEPAVQYTISASTRYAYDAEANRIIHPGETVYLRATNTLTHVGVGVVTSVSGSSFNVDILSGNFDSDEAVSIFRDDGYSATERIGRGNASRSGYTAYEGSGIIVKYHVANQSEVKKGDVLFETIEGTFAGYTTDLTEIKAAENGVITGLNVSLGDAIAEGSTLCTLYPDSAMRVEASVNEEYLAALQEGGRVTVHFTFAGNGEKTVEGTVEQVSAIGTEDATGESEEAFYDTVIELDDIVGVKYGMTVTVTD